MKSKPVEPGECRPRTREEVDAIIAEVEAKEEARAAQDATVQAERRLLNIQSWPIADGWAAHPELRARLERGRGFYLNYVTLDEMAPYVAPLSILRRCFRAGQLPGRRKGKLLFFRSDVAIAFGELLETGRAGVGKATVYFAQDGDVIKIGRAKTNVAKRLATLATGNPRGIKLLGTLEGTLDTEPFLHWHFSYLRQRGEWFHASPILLNWIAEHAKAPAP